MLILAVDELAVNTYILMNATAPSLYTLPALLAFLGHLRLRRVRRGPGERHGLRHHRRHGQVRSRWHRSERF